MVILIIFIQITSGCLSSKDNDICHNPSENDIEIILTITEPDLDIYNQSAIVKIAVINNKDRPIIIQKEFFPMYSSLYLCTPNYETLEWHNNEDPKNIEYRLDPDGIYTKIFNLIDYSFKYENHNTFNWVHGNYSLYLYYITQSNTIHFKI